MNNYAHSSFLPIEKIKDEKKIKCKIYELWEVFCLSRFAMWGNLKKMPGDIQKVFVTIENFVRPALWCVTHLKEDGFKLAKVWTL